MTPFYKKALALFTRTQENQIQKGLAKYPEPFNPHNWTPEELLNHALEETVDLTHYLVGLKELLDAKDRIIEDYRTGIKTVVDAKDKEITRLKEELEYANGFKTVYAKEIIKLTKPTEPETKQEKTQMVLTNVGKSGLYKKKSPFEEQYDMNFNPHFDTDDQ